MQKYKVFIDNSLLIVTDSDKKIDNLESFTRVNSDSKDLTTLASKLITNTLITSKDPQTTFGQIFQNFKKVEAAGCLVRNPNDEFLVIKRFGLWDLPKGKLEKNESISECASREVEEETGVSVKVINELITTYHTYYRNGNVVKPTYWFYAETNGSLKTSPQTEEDIEEVRWMNRQEIIEHVFLNTYPAIRDVFKSLDASL